MEHQSLAAQLVKASSVTLQLKESFPFSPRSGNRRFTSHEYAKPSRYRLAISCINSVARRCRDARSCGQRKRVRELESLRNLNRDAFGRIESDPYRAKAEFMAGFGLERIHTREKGLTTNLIAGEAVQDFMFWPMRKRKFGWYLEPGYDGNLQPGTNNRLGSAAAF
jgi:hypothetical protein